MTKVVLCGWSSYDTATANILLCFFTFVLVNIIHYTLYSAHESMYTGQKIHLRRIIEPAVGLLFVSGMIQLRRWYIKPGKLNCTPVKMTTIYISTIHILIARSFSDKMTITIVLICNKKKSLCIAIIANRVWCDSFNNTMYSTTTTSYWSSHVYTVFPQGKYSYRERYGDVLTRLKMGFVELRQKYPSSSNNGALGCFVQNDLVNCVIHCSQCIYYLNGWVLLHLHCQRFFCCLLFLLRFNFFCYITWQYASFLLFVSLKHVFNCEK